MYRDDPVRGASKGDGKRLRPREDVDTFPVATHVLCTEYTMLRNRIHLSLTDTLGIYTPCREMDRLYAIGAKDGPRASAACEPSTLLPRSETFQG